VKPEYVQFPGLCRRSIPLWYDREIRIRRRDRVAKAVIVANVVLWIVLWIAS
jgi:hypothetical protein